MISVIHCDRSGAERGARLIGNRPGRDGWIASSHRALAVCNDCRVARDVVGNYATKADNSSWPCAIAAELSPSAGRCG